ncbi:hypothetical protein NDU88_008385 [Pleurodeles waltl]|uniref:Uncharacterized protein n=1 Tax=Pleurodeles waltl TaxID=8319 RepID=A0AAV7PS07_PLEWA|nr:hypothetical protein NDU88_008385 [Pleurodeles waltl]
MAGGHYQTGRGWDKGQKLAPAWGWNEPVTPPSRRSWRLDRVDDLGTKIEPTSWIAQAKEEAKQPTELAAGGGRRPAEDTIGRLPDRGRPLVTTGHPLSL